MLNFKKHPSRLVLFTAVFLSLIIFFFQIAGMGFQDRTIFMVPLMLLVWTISVALIFFWLLYLFTTRFLYSRLLIWLHIVITVSTAILILTSLYHGVNPLHPTASRYYDSSLSDNQVIVYKTIPVVFIILVCGQVLYPANILLGVFWRKPANSH